MQLDNIGLYGQTVYRMPGNGDPWAQELWSWKANCDTGIQVIRRKEQMAKSYLRETFPNENDGYIMPMDITINGVSFTANGTRKPDDLETIKEYNGGRFWLTYNDQSGAWTHVQLGMGSNGDYTERIIREL